MQKLCKVYYPTEFDSDRVYRHPKFDDDMREILEKPFLSFSTVQNNLDFRKLIAYAKKYYNKVSFMLILKEGLRFTKLLAVSGDFQKISI